MKLVLIIALALGLFFCIAPVKAEQALYDISGHPFVIDGDTLKFRTAKVRFLCMDAPENGQVFGTEATHALAALINGKQVRCIGKWYDNYHRILAFCRVGETDLIEGMVKQGMAVAEGGYQCRVYKQLAKQAKRDKTGIWADPSFIKPSTWRKLHKRQNQE